MVAVYVTGTGRKCIHVIYKYINFKKFFDPTGNMMDASINLEVHVAAIFWTFPHIFANMTTLLVDESFNLTTVEVNTTLESTNEETATTSSNFEAVTFAAEFVWPEFTQIGNNLHNLSLTCINN